MTPRTLFLILAILALLGGLLYSPKCRVNTLETLALFGLCGAFAALLLQFLALLASNQWIWFWKWLVM